MNEGLVMFSKSIKFNNTNEENSSVPQVITDNSVPQIPKSPVPQLPFSQDLSLTTQSDLLAMTAQVLSEGGLPYAQAMMALQQTPDKKTSEPEFKPNQATLFYAILDKNYVDAAAHLYVQEFGLSKNKFADVILNAVNAKYGNEIYRRLVKSIKKAKLESTEYKHPSSYSSVPPSQDLVKPTALDLPPLDTFLKADEYANEIEEQAKLAEFLHKFHLRYAQNMEEKEKGAKEKLDKEMSIRVYRSNQADAFYLSLKNNNCEKAAEIFLKEFGIYENEFADVILEAVEVEYGDTLCGELVTAIEKIQLEKMYNCLEEFDYGEISVPKIIGRGFYDQYTMPIINSFMEGYQPAFERFTGSRSLSPTPSYPTMPRNSEELLDLIKTQISDYAYVNVEKAYSYLNKRKPIPALLNDLALSLPWFKQLCIEASQATYTPDQLALQLCASAVIDVCNRLQNAQYNFSQKVGDVNDIFFMANILNRRQFFLADALLLSATAAPNTLHLIYCWFVDDPNLEIQAWIRNHEWHVGQPEPGKLKPEPDEPCDKTQIKLLLDTCKLSIQTNPMHITHHSKLTLDMHEASPPVETETSSQFSFYTPNKNAQHRFFTLKLAGIEAEIQKMLRNKTVFFSKTEVRALADELSSLSHGIAKVQDITQILHDYLHKHDMPFEEISVKLRIPKEMIGSYNHIVTYLFFTAIENSAYAKAAIIYFEIQNSRYKNLFKETKELVTAIRAKLGQEVVDKFVDALTEHIAMLRQQLSEQPSVRALR